MPNIVEIIKKSAIDAVKASKPVDIIFGIVESISPLKIVTEQKLPLGPYQLMLSRNVTNYSVDMVRDGFTSEYMIKNELKVGEKVILIRQQGGQLYLVLDRVVSK